MAKDKKGKSEGKKAKAAEKKQKQEKKADKKAKTKAARDQGSDAEDNVDLDAVLDEYRRQQEQFHRISETVAEEPPKPRSAATLVASTAAPGKNELLLFGGEYFNGALATFFNDLHVYSVARDEWRVVTSPNAPLPRSGHAWCVTRTGHVYLFGGEFSSPKQGTFYHYNDFWTLEPKTREWTKLEPKGKTPPSRSGHRLVAFQQYIILFGGFQDTSNATKYLGDLWIYDTRNFVWYNPALPPAQLKPDPRSSFTFLPHEQGAVLFGGYSRVKTSVAANKGGKAGSQGQRNVLKPMIHQDCFFLRITATSFGDGADAGKKQQEKAQAPTVRWERRKKPANLPAPSRAGTTMAYHKGRGILFGGVHDVEEDEEGMDSEFFNQLFAWNVERNRFFPLALRKPRNQGQKKAAGGGEQRVGGRRGRAAANEEELLKQLAALETGASLEDADEMDIDRNLEEADEDDKKMAREMPVSMELPHPRFNALLAVQDDTLYIYGGTFEKGDREFTFNDLYAIDLVKMDGCKEIFRKEVEDWVESEDEDEDEDDEEDEDEDEDEEEDEEGDIEVAGEQKKFTPSTRKKKQQSDEASVGDPESTAASSAGTEDDDDTETTATSVVGDGLPYPRPFESRRDFFNRTSNEWQEVLMASLGAKGVAIESLTVKDIKAKAFQLSEEKWWDSREEITRLEEEQEAAGIGEVVSLAERGETGAGGGGGGARRR